MTAINQIQDIFDTIKSQSINWGDLGFDGNLNRILQDPSGFGKDITADDFEALIETGGIDSAILKVFDPNKFLDNSISNSVIKPNFRSFKAVVGHSGSAGTDFSNIQSAIDKVNSLGGGPILIKEGTYTVINDITVYSKIQLYGEGPGKTIIDFNSTANQFKRTGTAGDLSNLTGFSDDAFQDIVFSNMKIRRSQDANGAIYLQYVRNVLIENCMFDNNTFDVFLNTCFPAVIKDNTSINDGESFKVSGGYVLIDNNIIDGKTGDGIKLSGGGNASSIKVRGNLFNSVDESSIEIDGGANYTIIDNQINGSDNPGIRLIGTSTIPRNVFIGYNKILNDIDGITVSKGEYIKIIGNTIDNMTTGITIDDADNTQVINNSVAQSTTGISVTGNADRTLIDGNDVEDNTTPISDSGTNTTTGTNITA